MRDLVERHVDAVLAVDRREQLAVGREQDRSAAAAAGPGARREVLEVLAPRLAVRPARPDGGQHQAGDQHPGKHAQTDEQDDADDQPSRGDAPTSSEGTR